MKHADQSTRCGQSLATRQFLEALKEIVKHNSRNYASHPI